MLAGAALTGARKLREWVAALRLFRHMGYYGHCQVERLRSDRFWMGVGQPVPWPSVPERDHLGMRLALLPFRVSFRDVEQLMATRGVLVSYETVRCWCDKFGKQYAHGLANSMPMALADDVLEAGDKWHLDEVFLKISGLTHYLCEQSIRTVLCSIFWFNRRGIGLPQSAF